MSAQHSSNPLDPASPSLPRRDDPDSWYPAGRSEVAARRVILASGEVVRVVEPLAEPTLAAERSVLLLHGWGCNAFHFRRLIPALAQRGIRAYAPDIRGHGLSQKPPDVAAYTAEALTDFTLELMDALGLARCGILGHSLGGALALDTAARAPERVAWLLLLNPVGLARLPYAPLFPYFPLAIADRAPFLASRAIARSALHLAYGRIARPERGDLEQYLYPALAPRGRYGILAYARSYAWTPRQPELLARIICPTRALFGGRDRVIRFGEAAERLRAIPRVANEVVAEAGHVLAEEVPQYVAEAAQALADSVSLTTRDAAQA